MARTVEVDEEQLQRDTQLRTMLTKIMANPQAAKLAEQAYKMVEPNARTPHLDQDKIIQEPIAELSKKFDEYVTAQKTAKEEEEARRKVESLSAQIDAGLNKLRASGGWTDEGISEVKKLMEEKGILDPDIAAAYFEKLHPAPVPLTPRGSGAWNFLSPPTGTDADDNIKKLIESKGDSDPLVDKIVRDVLNDARGSRR
jgi:hypothetical protein